MALDLNCDMGESFGVYTLGADQELMPLVTSANLACGFHAADPLVMERTLALAREHGTAVGAHPGYRDLAGFGRRRMACTPREIHADVLYQIGALEALARAAGLTLRHVKPHGALYNRAAAHQPTARAVAQAVADFDPKLILVTLAGPAGEMSRLAAADFGLRTAAEAFADRAYTSQGFLVPRSEPGAVIEDVDAVVARSVQMAQSGTVKAQDGGRVELAPHTLCLHGDTPGAAGLAAKIRQALEQAGVELKPLAELV